MDATIHPILTEQNIFILI